MEIVATLLVDVPLDASNFHGLLLDLSATALSGAIQQQELKAFHTFGEASEDPNPREIRVCCLPANTAPRAALRELKKQGFSPATALEFSAPTDLESQEDAWTLLGVYARELRGWAITNKLDFDEASERLGSEDGILHAPLGGKKKGVLISSNALRLLT